MRLNAPRGLFADNSLIRLKDDNWLEKQRVAGKVTAGALLLLEDQVKRGTDLSLQELSFLAEGYIQDHSGCTPTFKGYKGFPDAVCISVNKQLVHGIPTSYVLQEGDLVSFDLGATYQGAIADTAITCIYGQPKSDTHVKLVKATEEALMIAIGAIDMGRKLGAEDRIGIIGQAISKCAKEYGFNVINNYGGHGLDWETPHAQPFVENISTADKGVRIHPGLAIAIEPMFVLGSVATTTAEDGWTVMTPDLSAHFEHSIFVHSDRVEIITDRSL
jgi:methionyl aminopeptidase